MKYLIPIQENNLSSSVSLTLFKSKFTFKSICFFALLSCLFFSACKKEETSTVLIDPAFEEYVDRFFAEANKRGVDLIKEDIQVNFEDLEDDRCGYGITVNSAIRTVGISDEPSCWEDFTEIQKETFMFHELGHAVLKRQHRDALLPNGMFKSIMRGGSAIGIASDTYNDYKLATRSYYLDELFRVSDAIPEWGKEKTEQTLVFQDNFEALDTNWMFFTSTIEPDTNFSRKIILGENGANSFAKITSKEAADNKVFAAWRYNIFDQTFSEGGTLKLKVNISAKDLIGEGISIVLRIDSESNGSREISGFSSTQEGINITGTFESKEFTTQIGYYPTDVNRIAIFLVMIDNTKGEVQFNNVELSYLE